MSDESQESECGISISEEMGDGELQVESELQPVDEIQPEELEKCIVNIEALLEFDPTGSLQAPIDNNNEQKPSIVSDISKPKPVHFKTHNAWEFVRFMRARYGLNVGSFLGYIHENRDQVLSYYQTKEKYRCTKGFLEYLLMNSCILVFAILSFQKQWGTEGVDSTETEENTTDLRDQRYSGVFEKLHQCVMEDPMVFKSEMVAMDCQIPWFVVQAVYTKHSKLSERFGTSIEKLARSCFDDLYPKVHESKKNNDTSPLGGFKHLLHMFHSTRSPEGKFSGDMRLLQPIKMKWFYIPSATDLQISATYFRKHAGDSINVSYHVRTLSGVMKLAPWHIFDNSIEIYKDLLKFESVYGEVCGFPITAYVACMVHLIQTEDDVRILQANGIIPITRGNRNNVLCEVEELKESLSDDVPMSDDLYDLSKKITAHHERKSTKYYGEFKRFYFASPWMTISVIAGIIYFSFNLIDAIYNALFYYKI